MKNRPMTVCLSVFACLVIFFAVVSPGRETWCENFKLVD